SPPRTRSQRPKRRLRSRTERFWDRRAFIPRTPGGLMVPITLVNVLILCAAAALVVVVQPSLLGASASMCGEEKKGWGTRLAAILIAGLTAGLGQLVYGVTLGLVLGKLGTFPVALGAIAVGFGITSVVYS